MGMENHRPRPNHFPTLASGVAWRADLIKPTIRSRQGICLWEGDASGRLVLFHPRRSLPTAHQSGRINHQRKGRVCARTDRMSKEGTERFHWSLIKRIKKTRKRRAMG